MKERCIIALQLVKKFQKLCFMSLQPKHPKLAVMDNGRDLHKRATCHELRSRYFSPTDADSGGTSSERYNFSRTETKERLIKIHKMNPPEFKDSKEPGDILDWITEIEKLFTVFKPPDEQKIAIASHYLKKSAHE